MLYAGTYLNVWDIDIWHIPDSLSAGQPYAATYQIRIMAAGAGKALAADALL